MLRILVILRQHPSLLKALLFGAAALSVVFDCFAERHGLHFWGDSIKGFWAIFAFLGAVAMIALFKGIYHAWLMKDTTYYD